MSSAGAYEVRVTSAIDHICNELKLTAFVRAKCIELCSRVKPKENAKVSDPAAKAIACAIVSIVHEEAMRHGRVDRHLPDRIVGKIFGLTSIGVVYNKRLINKIMNPSQA